MVELVAPDPALRDAWLECHREWGPGVHEDGFGLAPDDDVESPNGFAAWVDRIRAKPAHFWWIVDRDAILGGIVLRTTNSDQVLRTGHVGYGIRPSARRRGLASWALAEIRRHGRAAGLERLLLVCADDNVASIKTIEGCGGLLEGTVSHGADQVRRYWVSL
ncbi:GNAT family N-acetyltransferase [Nocardioides sp. NBC_00163]|uniref:GNAT family N-acetyltransferase n=1 Tax=Nocardioides sp. NBC_00163 TaxID=2975999 RepID=UPI00324AB265